MAENFHKNPATTNAAEYSTRFAGQTKMLDHALKKSNGRSPHRA
ncbi:MAG: hypothetical protein ABI476_02915 [Oxalobacteraceae bacterium]